MPSLKIRCGEEIRRFKVDDGATFSDISRALRVLLSVPDHEDIIIRYLDDEGDKITLSSDVELREALSCCTEPIQLYVTKCPKESNLTQSTLDNIDLGISHITFPARGRSSLLPQSNRSSLDEIAQKVKQEQLEAERSVRAMQERELEEKRKADIRESEKRQFEEMQKLQEKILFEKQQEEKRREEEKLRILEMIERSKQNREEAERNRRKEEEARKQLEEQEKIRIEEEKKQLEEEKRREEERKRVEEEEQEKKRVEEEEEEKKKEEEAEKKRIEEETKRREEEKKRILLFIEQQKEKKRIEEETRLKLQAQATKTKESLLKLEEEEQRKEEEERKKKETERLELQQLEEARRLAEIQKLSEIRKSQDEKELDKLRNQLAQNEAELTKNSQIDNQTPFPIEFVDNSSLDYYRSRSGDYVQIDSNAQILKRYNVNRYQRMDTPSGKGIVIGVDRQHYYLWFQLDKDSDGLSFWDDVKDYDSMVCKGIVPIEEEVTWNMIPLPKSSLDLLNDIVDADEKDVVKQAIQVSLLYDTK